MKVMVVFTLVSFFLGSALQAMMSEDRIKDKAEEELVWEMVSPDVNFEEGLEDMDDNNVNDDEDGYYQDEQDDDDQLDNDRLKDKFLLEDRVTFGEIFTYIYTGLAPSAALITKAVMINQN